MAPTTLKFLPTSSVAEVSQLLQLQPHETSLSYSDRVSRMLTRLPPSLKHKPRHSLSKLLFSSTPLPTTPTEAHLCLLHKPLSAPLLHELFTLLSLEVGAHCNSLIAHNAWLSPAQHTAVQRLRELHSLWLPPETYQATFLRRPNPRWGFQESRCEGCVLTRVGSDVEVVAGLRVLLRSRRRTERPQKGHPRLLGFVEGWLDGLVGVGEMGREVRSGGEMEAMELKIVRKRICQERSEKRRVAKGKGRDRDGREMGEDGTEGGTLDERKEERYEEEMAQEVCDFDAEHEIIDSYAKLRETLYLPSLQPSPEQTPSLTTGSSARTLSSHVGIEDAIQPDLLGYPPEPSIYSVHHPRQESTYQPPRRAPAWQIQQPSAAKQAERYRDLLTPPAEEPEYSPSSKGTERNERYYPQINPAGEMVESAQVPPAPSTTEMEDMRWDTRDYRAPMRPAQEEFAPPPKPMKEAGKRRHTRWSNFSPHPDDARETVTDISGHSTHSQYRRARQQGKIEAKARGRLRFVRHFTRMKTLLRTHLGSWRQSARQVERPLWPTLSFGEFQLQTPVTGVQ